MGIAPRRYTEIGLLCGVWGPARWVMKLADRSGDANLTLREVEKALSVYAG